jgi:PAS domain S-box-containing protein
MINKLKNKIVLIAPNPDIALMANQVSKEFGHVLEVKQGNLTEGVHEARRAYANGRDIIISRGGTALMIEKELNIHVIYIVFSSVDLIKTIEKARLYDSKIGIMGYDNLFGEINGNYDFLGCQLYVEKVQEQSEFKEKIRILHEKENIHVFIGGEAVAKAAEEQGLKGIIMECGIESIRRAVIEAIRLAEMKMSEKERYLLFRAVSEHSSDGIIVVNEESKIMYINPVAQNTFVKNQENVIGLSITDLVPHSKLSSAMEKKTPILSTYEQIYETKILANYIPLEANNTLMGGIMSFQDVTKIEELERKVRREQYAKGLVAKYRFEDILTKDPKMKQVIENARRIARSDSTVLISGESGTGKELIAQSIHNASPRKNGPFVAINCAALPESLLESELFGYVDGAFTGARKSGKPGLFELSHLGTIFLDEIGDIPLSVQSRLLRVIQEKEVNRIGDDRVIPVNIRIIAASNKTLAQLITEGKFRDDLYYRLDIVRIKLPPLRERVEDIDYLCKHFLNYYSKLNHLKTAVFTKRALEILRLYSWPGNIRELQNFIEGLVIINDSDIIEEGMVEQMLKDKLDNNSFFNIKYEYEKKLTPTGKNETKAGLLRRLEYQSIKEVLEQVKGDRAKAAKVLGISTTTLWRRLKELEH